MSDLIVHNLGRISYQDALDVQQALVARMQASRDEPPHLLLLEHDPPVITLGRRGRDEDILAGHARLDALGVEIHRSRRGGQVTWHGPGQLVAYPIVNLAGRPGGVRGFVCALEEAVIRLLADFGIQADRREGVIGVWAGGAKVAAVGVAVARWVTFHGLAVNVTRDAAGAFDLIVPCGQAGGGAVTSLSHLAGRDVAVDETTKPLTNALCATLGFDDATCAELPILRGDSGER